MWKERNPNLLYLQNCKVLQGILLLHFKKRPPTFAFIKTVLCILITHCKNVHIKQELE